MATSWGLMLAWSAPNVSSQLDVFPGAARTNDHSLGGLETAEMHPVTVLEVRSVKSRHWQAGPSGG